MIRWLNSKIIAYITQKAQQQRSVDIIEVKVKEIGLLSVKSETILKLENTFILPIQILTIEANLYNGDVLVGEMNYNTPQKIPKKSSITISTISEISIITSFFQLISNFLSQPIKLRSIGKARLKTLWWIIEIDVDDTFIVLPHQLKIGKDLTEEEKIEKIKLEAERREKRKIRLEAEKEEKLKRRHRDEYIPKEDRNKVIEEKIEEEIEEIYQNSEIEAIEPPKIDESFLENEEQIN